VSWWTLKCLTSSYDFVNSHLAFPLKISSSLRPVPHCTRRCQFIPSITHSHQHETHGARIDVNNSKRHSLGHGMGALDPALLERVLRRRHSGGGFP
jgi:hypothetical protein